MRSLILTAFLAAALVACRSETETAPTQPAPAPASAPSVATAPAAPPVTAPAAPPAGDSAPVQAPAAAPAPAPPTQVPEAQADGSAEAEPTTAPPESQVTNALLEERLLALASCDLGPQGIDPECEAMARYKEGRSSDAMLAAFNKGTREVGRRHLTNPSAAVRLQATQLLGSLHKASPEDQQPLIDAASTEADDYVAVQMLRRLGTSIGRNPKVLELMMASSRHEVPEVRMEAVLWLLSGWARTTEGTLERALELAEKDPVRRVRRIACRRLGERSDDRAMPLLRKLTAGPGNDPELYAACLMGLIGMWAYPTPHDPPSKKAYDLTMRRLKAVPRTTEIPPWNALSGLQWSKKELFRARAKWFKPKALERLLETIANDRGAGWQTRNVCVELLVEIDAPKEALERLLEAYKGVSRDDGDDRYVLGKIEALLGITPPGGALMLPELAIPDPNTAPAPGGGGTAP